MSKENIVFVSEGNDPPKSPQGSFENPFPEDYPHPPAIPNSSAPPGDPPIYVTHLPDGSSSATVRQSQTDPNLYKVTALYLRSQPFASGSVATPGVSRVTGTQSNPFSETASFFSQPMTWEATDLPPSYSTTNPITVPIGDNRELSIQVRESSRVYRAPSNSYELPPPPPPTPASAPPTSPPRHGLNIYNQPAGPPTPLRAPQPPPSGHISAPSQNTQTALARLPEAPQSPTPSHLSINVDADPNSGWEQDWVSDDEAEGGGHHGSNLLAEHRQLVRRVQELTLAQPRAAPSPPSYAQATATGTGTGKGTGTGTGTGSGSATATANSHQGDAGLNSALALRRGVRRRGGGEENWSRQGRFWVCRDGAGEVVDVMDAVGGEEGEGDDDEERSLNGDAEGGDVVMGGAL